jgi:hypothetical protein
MNAAPLRRAVVRLHPLIIQSSLIFYVWQSGLFRQLQLPQNQASFEFPADGNMVPEHPGPYRDAAGYQQP